MYAASVWRSGAQATMQENKKKELPGVRLIYVSQRWMPEDIAAEKEPVSRDVQLLGTGDDLRASFRLVNESKEAIYYLASVYDDEPGPTGYILFRQAGEMEWKATTPNRGRKGSLTGGGYKWVRLSPGTAVEFEFSDLNACEGEHAASVLVNNQPDHTGRIEIISNPYSPMCRGVKMTNMTVSDNVVP
jgi:hypothetical protein